MTAPITGSTAGTAFDEAERRLDAARLTRPRARVPFDFSTGPAPAAAPWRPARVATLGGHGPIVVAARALRDRTATAADLLAVALAAAARHEALGGIATLRADEAREEARRLDAELAAGHDRGPLHGIPITVKDVIDVAGIPTRAGSAAYFDVPTTDAVGVARLRAAGAVVLAKATTHEFALGVTTPQSRNPRDPDRIPGGSSGGSAICVACGIGLGSLGTDTRASIRVPAALSGVVGLKPTYGRVPTDGVLSLSWTMDHLAPMAATVGDAALLLDALLGGDSRLAWTGAGPLDGLRVGVATAGFADAHPVVVDAVQRALATLGELGAHTAPAATPSSDDLELANALGLVISRCEAAAAHRTLGLDRGAYWEEVAEQLDRADEIRAVDYLDAQRLRAELRDHLLGAFADHDVIALPSAPVLAPRASDFARYLLVLSRNAIPWSLVGFPAISLPVATGATLPVGLQLVAPPEREDVIVRVATALESRLAETIALP